MKVRNPHERAIIVTMVDEVREPRSIEVPAGETHETDDYVVASTLVEYGCVADPVDLQAAREAWADRNRDENSRTASASASEGAILGRQTTVDVSTGTVANGGAKVGELRARPSTTPSVGRTTPAPGSRRASRPTTSGRPSSSGRPGRTTRAGTT